jgi:exopolysaccharide biosynthesis polyprenyl glycosylphosphotransferase
MNRNLQILKYLSLDFFAAALSWFFFFAYRKSYIEHQDVVLSSLLTEDRLQLGLFGVSAFWLFFYTILGTYKNIYRKSRLLEFGQTFGHAVLGALVIFFTLILDDVILNYKTYYYSLFVYFSIHFGLTYIFRLILTSITAYKIHHRIIGFRTLMVGSNKSAVDLFDELESSYKSSGNKFCGYITVNKNSPSQFGEKLPQLGSVQEIDKIIRQYEVEEVIIAIENFEHDTLETIINDLESTKTIIKVIPNTYDLLSGSVKMTSMFDAPLIQIKHELMPLWQTTVKRLVDITVSAMALILLSPLYAITALLVKLSSKGPIFYKQERIGINGEPFYILKFRSMLQDAEKHGPQLSSTNDQRITPWGKVMRRYRLDELPQFFNVLIGDMSLVGPRPERQYFIDRIVVEAPHYKHLLKVKPGITSWGMVKYGYAENVSQMVDRLQYDIIYIENLSLVNDLKVLIYTVLIVVQGRGK